MEEAGSGQRSHARRSPSGPLSGRDMWVGMGSRGHRDALETWLGGFTPPRARSHLALGRGSQLREATEPLLPLAALVSKPTL